MTILPLTGGEPPLPRLAEHLRAGGFAPLLADRDLSRSARGGDALRPRGADAAGPGHARRWRPVPRWCPSPPPTGGEPTSQITFHEEVDVVGLGVAAATQRVADAFTAALVADPADWHMMQRVFVDDLEPR